MENKASNEKKDLEISWIGMDGFLVALYFVLVGIIYYAISAHNDFIIGRLIPYGIMLTVTAIFGNYLSTVFKFMKKAKDTASASKEVK
ncbi:MAG: hypothetical protein ACM3TR_14815 [Caulobacteraceae bacterium]